MSKNIVINIYGSEFADIEDIEVIQDKNILIKGSKNIVTDAKYDLEIDSTVITDLELKSRVRLSYSNQVKIFKYNYFIYENEIYIVYVNSITDNEISFFHPKFAENLSIELSCIHNLCNVKVVC